jgi:hypothetical protein
VKIRHALLALALFTAPAFAQFSVTIGTPEPVCDYGYYDYAPYSCAPEGFYGPEFFIGGRYHPRNDWEHRDRHGDDRGRNRGFFGGHKDNGYHEHDDRGHKSDGRRGK